MESLSFYVDEDTMLTRHVRHLDEVRRGKMGPSARCGIRVAATGYVGWVGSACHGHMVCYALLLMRRLAFTFLATVLVGCQEESGKRTAKEPTPESEAMREPYHAPASGAIARSDGRLASSRSSAVVRKSRSRVHNGRHLQRVEDGAGLVACRNEARTESLEGTRAPA